MDLQSDTESVQVPSPVPVPAPVPAPVPELDDVSLDVPTEPVGSIEDPEADKENSHENEARDEDRDENVSKILNRNYYQIAHDLQHDGGGGKNKKKFNSTNFCR